MSRPPSPTPSAPSQEPTASPLADTLQTGDISSLPSLSYSTRPASVLMDDSRDEVVGPALYGASSSSNQSPLAEGRNGMPDLDAAPQASDMRSPPTHSGLPPPSLEQADSMLLPNDPPTYPEPFKPLQSAARPLPNIPRHVLTRYSSDPAISLVTAADRVAANPRPMSMLQVSTENIASDTETLLDEDLFPLEYYKSPEYVASEPDWPDSPLNFGSAQSFNPSIVESFHHPATVPDVSPGPPPVYAVSDRDVRLERLGDELASDSSVWCTYITAAGAHDKDMVDGWNKSLDVLLIFASLFSAVVTAFVIESSKLLQPDYNQATALLTAQVLKALTNPSGSSSLTSIESADQILAFKTPRSSKTVNTLWFSALGFSLSSVLVAMLAKQWLASYDSHSQDEPLEASCERQRKFDGLHKWSLPYILAALPALLHISLFLFLAGLIMYLWNLDSVVSQTTCIIITLLFIFYFASGILAIFDPNCPYQTPLSQFIRSRVGKVQESKHDPSERLISKAVMWLADTNDPKMISTALQSLAGLRRGFVGYRDEQAEHIARFALEHLRACFITEWRHGGSYNLRTEKQYHASCYLRTLMHFVDDPRRIRSSGFAGILADPALPTFMQLLGSCPERSIALLALCDYQRLLHRTEVTKWLSAQFQHLREVGDFRTVVQLIRHEPSKANMTKILQLIHDYLKGRNFLHPYTVEVAVETIACAPIAWTANFSPSDSLHEYLDPLIRLLRSTRGGGTGVRRALARTFDILVKVHALSVFPQPDDFVMRFQYALDLSVASMVKTSDESEKDMRGLFLSALSYCISMFGKEEVLAENFFDELFYECDRLVTIGESSFSDNPTVAALLPLLLAPSLSHDQKGKVITRLYANVVSAATEVDPSENILTFPSDAFPSDTVPFLIRTLDSFKENTHSWLGDTSILLYMVSRESPHRDLLLVQAPLLISIVNTAVLEEVANRLFWILTSVLWDAVKSSDETMIQALMSAGIVPMLSAYCDKYGLTPADAHAWADILTLPVSGGNTSEPVSRRELTEKLCSVFEGQDEERLQHLFRLREPIYQFSYQYSTAYTSESALEALRALKQVYADPEATSASDLPAAPTGQEAPASPAIDAEPTPPDGPLSQPVPENDEDGGGDPASMSPDAPTNQDVPVIDTPPDGLLSQGVPVDGGGGPASSTSPDAPTTQDVPVVDTGLTPPDGSPSQDGPKGDEDGEGPASKPEQRDAEGGTDRSNHSS